jgi:hypothetical protein
VVGSFATSDNHVRHLPARLSVLVRPTRVHERRASAVLARPLADGTLVATSEIPSEDLIPSLLTLSDVMGTGWFAADAANVKPGSTVAVVGNGAVGLLGVLSAKQMGAKRVIAMSIAGRQGRYKELQLLDFKDVGGGTVQLRYAVSG